MNRDEDFDAWKLAHALNMKVFEMTSAPAVANDFKFRNNLHDAADSAERNFPEGFGRFAPGDFAHFLDNSKAPPLETKNGLQVGLERGYFKGEDVKEATALVDRTLGALTGLQRYLRSPRAREHAKRIRSRHTSGERKPSTEPSN